MAIKRMGSSQLFFGGLLAIIASGCIGGVRADCAVDDNGYRRCDSGLSWTARLWIYVAAGVFLIILTALFGWYLRRRHRRKQAILPAAPGAATYAQGEFYEQRRASLGLSYAPPRHLRPVVTNNPSPPTNNAATANLSMVESRQSVPGYLYPGGPIPRTYNRSNLPPPPEYAEAEPTIGNSATADPVASLSGSSQDTLTQPEAHFVSAEQGGSNLPKPN